MASLLLAYILWLFGGAFGLHHLYLGRTYHAFVWYSTLGGVLGLGWIRELWRLPDYVRSSNANKEYQKRQFHRMGLNPSPNSGIPRFIGMYVMGFLVSSVLCGVLPIYDEETPGYLFLRMCSISLVLVGSSLGVYIVGNVGDLQCTWKCPVVGALLSTPWLILSPANITVAALLSTMVTWWKGLCWKQVAPLKSNRLSKCGKFLALTALWTSVLCYGLYFNTSVSFNGEERIPLKVVIQNFFASSAWQTTKDSFYRLWQAFINDGWDHAYNDAFEVFDFSGEVHALKIIGLPKNASRAEITKHCRKISAKSHPDRFRTESEKEKAQSRFIEIQDACSTLSKHRSKGSGSHQENNS